jgi:hypothetical protein
MSRKEGVERWAKGTRELKIKNQKLTIHPFLTIFHRLSGKFVRNVPHDQVPHGTTVPCYPKRRNRHFSFLILHF